jgi:lactate dehydrogenase-like 2-hydroxyacid dehydrogenase
MKAVAYSIKPFEKEYLAKANQKKHDITLISNPLSTETAIYAEGKNVAIVSPNDDVSAAVIQKLAGYGIKYIVARSTSIDYIDKDAAAKYGIKLSNLVKVPLLKELSHTKILIAPHQADVTDEALQEIAYQTIKNLDTWQPGKCTGDTCTCNNNCRTHNTVEPQNDK